MSFAYDLANNGNVRPIGISVMRTREITGLGNTTVWKLIKEGKLRTAKVGGRTLVLYDSVEALFRECAAKPNAVHFRGSGDVICHC
jgi:excisionase family DNA binding protein